MDLVQFVIGFRDMLEADPYKLSSIVKILDICVGPNDSLTTVERVSKIYIIIEQNNDQLI